MERTTNCKPESYAKLMNGPWWGQFYSGSNPWMARYVYGFIFLISTVLAWAVRDYSHSSLKELFGFKECGKDCMGTDGVLRVSLGCFIFYFIMFVSTAGTSKLYETREFWHSGWWSSKVFLMIGLVVLSFLAPSCFIEVYGEIAHFGAGVFQLIQLISIIKFITWLNECCRSDEQSDRCHIHVMLLATTTYLICIIGIIMMYIWYTPYLSCLLNVFFITFTLVLLQVMTNVSLHPKVHAGFLTPGLMGLYIVFLCWCAIRSEPPEAKCIKTSEDGPKQDWLTIISFVIAVLAIVIATFSTGIDSKCFQFRKDEKSEDDIPYGFGFFHFVFATGAMYFSMLLIGWNTHHTMPRWTIDVGWTSTWVRIVNEWLAAALYIWILVAPVVWKNRHNNVCVTHI